jgi:plasmid stabilization system protein ParE
VQPSSKAAVADLSSILDYIAVQSPQGAKRVQGRIQGIIELLLSHPDFSKVGGQLSCCIAQN